MARLIEIPEGRWFPGADTQFEIEVVDSDATPVSGNALAYDPMIGPGDLSLRCRGVILRGAGLAELWSDALVLALFGIVVLLLAARRFTRMIV